MSNLSKSPLSLKGDVKTKMHYILMPPKYTNVLYM